MDWRPVDGVWTAWFAAPSLADGAALTGRVLELEADAAVDVRATGVRVRLDADEHVEAVSDAARDLGLAADPTVPQRVDVVLEATDTAEPRRFWGTVLGYAPGRGGLVDPLGRDPAVRVARSTEPRPLRNRIHLDVVRPATVVDGVGLGAGSGPYGVCHADHEGNEVDLVPGDPLGGTPATDDWQVVFAAMACYRVDTTAQQRDLVTAAAALAHDAGFPLLVDARPGLVVLDSGKDRWEADAHGLSVDFTDLAARLQSAARDLGATADPDLPRFVQLFLDAADVDAVRGFWTAALGYEPDRRTGVSDVHDPRRLDPVLVFQQIDTSETERRRQRNRVHVELAVPTDTARARADAAVAAGGRIVEESSDRWVVADPEGNELVVRSGA